MKIVADKLRDIALASKVDHEIDQFGRSAFNRYYYAVYLVVRKNLMEIDSGWAKSPHKNLPDVLTNAIKNSAKNKAKLLTKRGLLKESEKSSILTSIKICGEELSNILQSAYEARTYADYVPTEIVIRELDNLTLHKYTIKSAQSWPEKAERYAGQLLKVWRQLGE